MGDVALSEYCNREITDFAQYETGGAGNKWEFAPYMETDKGRRFEGATRI